LANGGKVSGYGSRDRKAVAESFSRFLRETRQARGLSIRQLARIAGVSNAYLSQVETGARGVPSPRILRRLARPLAVTPTRLLEMAGYMNAGQVEEDRRTCDLETLLRQETARWTLDGDPLSPEDIEAMLEFLRGRRRGE